MDTMHKEIYKWDDLKLETKINLIKDWLEVVFMPPYMKEHKFSKWTASRLARLWAQRYGLQDATIWINKANNITLAGDKKSLSDIFFGTSAVFHFAVITLNIKSMSNFTKKRSKVSVPMFANITTDQRIWATLLHELAHCATTREMPHPDHGISFRIRLVKSYLYAWWHYFYGVMK